MLLARSELSLGFGDPLQPAARSPDNALSRPMIRLRGRIHAAAQAAAEHRQTTYHATNSTITIGILGPDDHDRIKHDWTIREQPW
jgi:hypothetical protein